MCVYNGYATLLYIYIYIFCHSYLPVDIFLISIRHPYRLDSCSFLTELFTLDR